MVAVLSDAARRLWAKSSYDQDVRSSFWCPLWLHLQDTASVMEHLVTEWVLPALELIAQEQFSKVDGGTDPLEQCRIFACWLAALHDLGKASPAFQSKVSELDSILHETGLRHEPITPERRRDMPHGIAGFLALDSILEDLGWSTVPNRRAVCSVVAAHHGDPGTASYIEAAMGRPDLLGTGAWDDARRELFWMLTDGTGAGPYIESWSRMKFSQPFLVLLSGLVITADWLASCTDYFPLLSWIDDGAALLSPQAHQLRADTAWNRIELPAPWLSRDCGQSPDMLLRNRFSLGASSVATPMQAAAVEAARHVGTPGLLILQDSTGAGKTEAALMAAEILAARSGKSGVLFALPTQATTDAMFSRELDWLERIGEDYGEEESPDFYNVQLIHGRSRLNPRARALRRIGYMLRDRILGAFGGDDPGSLNFADIYDHDFENNPPPAAIAPWFAGRKRSMLADFVTTTVDHVLFAALKERHLAVRHLGLSRKVVVIDEVHSYSTYMGVFLDRALSWLAAYKVPVILLSATLSTQRCAELVGAYRKGLGMSPTDGESIASPFPSLISADAERVHITPCPAGRHARVRLCALEHEEDLIPLLRDRLAGGGCALVIRNTVRRAQETYAELSEVFGDAVTLSHARFTVGDRQAKDEDLLRRFGSPRVSTSRPRRAIVVATQVVEQSLDVDFDVLVTDLAPVDLILQRAGRLHRHQRPRPAGLTEPVCYISGLPRTDSAPWLEPGAQAIYGAKSLILTAAAIRTIMTSGDGSLRIPDDVRPLIEAVYGPTPSVPEPWTAALADAIAKDEVEKLRKRENARAFLLGEPRVRPSLTASLWNWLAPVIDDRGSSEEREMARAVVRDGDDSLEVILLDCVGDEGREELRTLPDSSGEPGSIIPTDRVPDRAVVDRMARSMVRLSSRFSGSRLSVAVNELEQMRVEAWQDDPLLRGQLVLPLRHGRATVAGIMLEYSSTEGLKEVVSR